MPRNDSSNPIDIEVGRRIRARRKDLGLSQENLAERLGLTFQQIQKYERGVNRISASKLFLTCQALGVEVAYFFDGIADAPAPTSEPNDINDMAELEEGREMATLYPRITSGRVRRRILEIVRAVVDAQ